MYQYTKNILLIGMIAGLIACGDSSTGPDVDPEDAPEFPQVQSEEAQPDISFFEDNEPKMSAGDKVAETNYYDEARQWVTLNSSTFTFAGMYSGFLLAGSDEEPEFEDGSWVWEYSYSYEGESVSMKVTAEELSDGYRWAMFWSYDDGETSYEDYKMLEGTVSEDGTSGDWSFNSLNTDTNEETLAYSSEWEISSDTEKTMSVRQYDESGNATLSADYEENQPEHNMTFSYPDDPDITVFWDTDTQEGYYEEDGERLCWDENFEDVSCD